MQKILLMITILGVSYAQELSIEKVSKLRNYNHSSSGKIRHKRLLQRTAVIKKYEAYILAKKECQGDVDSSKLLLHSNRLFYFIKTDRGTIKIDAIDAQIIERCYE